MQKRFGFYIRQGKKNPLPNEIRSGLIRQIRITSDSLSADA